MIVSIAWLLCFRYMYVAGWEGRLAVDVGRWLVAAASAAMYVDSRALPVLTPVFLAMAHV